MKAIVWILKVFGGLYVVIALFNQFNYLIESPAQMMSAVSGILSVIIHGFGAVALGLLLERHTAS